MLSTAIALGIASMALAVEEPRIYTYARSYTASVSMYSARETCRYGLHDNCINAKGTRPVPGTSIACPRKVKLGTHVIIEDQEYTCDDRTAPWIEQKFGDTYDIYTLDYQLAKRFGRRRLEVTIVK